MNFGETMSLMRKSRNITQAELARQVGVTKQAINNIERNISVPNVNTAALIAIALDTTIDYLAGTENKRFFVNLFDEKN